MSLGSRVFNLGYGMQSFPLAYILIPFAGIFLFSLFFFFFNVFHIKRYGIKQRSTTGVIISYFAVYGFVLLATFGYLMTIDWQEQFLIADILPFINTSSDSFDYGL